MKETAGLTNIQLMLRKSTGGFIMMELLETVRRGFDAEFNGWQLSYNKTAGVFIGRKNGKVVQRRNATIFANIIR